MSNVALIKASALKGTVAEAMDVQALYGRTVTLSKAEACAMSEVGRCKPVYALHLKVGRTELKVAGPSTPRAIVSEARDQLVMAEGAKAADALLMPRVDGRPSDRERRIAAMLRGGGMAATIGRLRITATFVGYVAA